MMSGASGKLRSLARTPALLGLIATLFLVLAVGSAAPATERTQRPAVDQTPARAHAAESPPQLERVGGARTADNAPSEASAANTESVDIRGANTDVIGPGGLRELLELLGLSKLGSPDSVGHPINVTTGNMYEYAEDLNIPSRGIPVQFVRFYNSQDTYSGPLGYGWTHIYNTFLQENEDRSVTVLGPDGARATFTERFGDYEAPHGVFDELTKSSDDGSFTLRKQNGMVWNFGADGKLQEITDPNGNALSFAYTGENLTRITDAVGRSTTLSYNASGRIVRITDPAGRLVRFGYSAAGDLVSVTEPAGKVTRYVYDASHNMTSSTNALGGATTFAYDAQDRAVSTQSTGGTQEVTVEYHPEDRMSLVTDSKGSQSTFYFDNERQITGIVDPYEEEISYTWNDRGNKTSVTDQLGNTTHMEYDERGNLTKVYEPRSGPSSITNPTTSVTYEPTFNRPTSITDPLGNESTFAYDAKGNLTATTDALGNRTTFEYDASGQLVKTTDPKGNATAAAGDGVTTFAYDGRGNLISTTDPAGKITRLTYGAAASLGSVLSLPSVATDPLGRTTNVSYDDLGHPTKITNPLTPPDVARTSVSVSYDAMGNPTGFTDERGKIWRSAYDDLGRLISETDPLGKRTTYSYDTEGNLVSMTDPLGNATTFRYDKVRRLTKVTRPDGTASGVSEYFSYDAAGRQVSATDAKGKTTAFAYDNLGRLISTTDFGPGGDLLQRASYQYDLAGRLLKATNPNGHATSYAYDALGQLTSETDPLGNTSSYSYDPNGNLKSRTDANGRTTSYAYDALDRLLSATYPDQSEMQMSYDAVGNLLSVADKTGTTRYAYDARDRLIKETLPGARVMRHSYDAAGNRILFSSPGDQPVSYTYDAASRLASVGDVSGKTSYTYDALGRPTKVSYPNGAAESYSYDPMGRVTRATATGSNAAGAAAVLSRLTYAYDKNSNPTSITDKAGKRSTYTYDALNRLTKETHTGLSLSYTYDRAGNRNSMTRRTPSATATIAYAYDVAERMTKAGPATFTYDKNGNMVSRTQGGTKTNYAYDFEDQLIKAGSETYTRDAFGRVASSMQGTRKTNYLFDGAEVIQEKTGAATTSYTRGLGGQLVDRRAGSGAPSFYHHDSIGSVVALSGQGAKLTDSYSYTAFGELREETGTSAQPYQYLGNAYDPQSELYDFHARAYDPAAGRFTSKDPVSGFAWMPQTQNPYAYGINGPLTYPDPSGRVIPLVIAGVVLTPELIAVGGAITLWMFYQLNTHSQEIGEAMVDAGQAIGETAAVAGQAASIALADLNKKAQCAAEACYLGYQVWKQGVDFDTLSDVADWAGRCLNPASSGMKKVEDSTQFLEMGSKGTPGNNQAQNKQFRDAVREGERLLGKKLNKGQTRQVHDEITGQGMSFHEIVQAVIDKFSGKG